MSLLRSGLLANRWAILLLIIAPLNFLLGVDRNALTVCSPLVRADLQIGAVAMAGLITTATAIYAFLQLPAGWFVQKIGVRWALFGACLLWSIATLATGLPHSLWQFAAARIALGIGQAPDWVASILALKLLFSEKDREAANSVLLGSLYIGYSASGWLTAWLMGFAGWRCSFQIFGLVGIAVSVLVFVLYGGASLEPSPQVREDGNAGKRPDIRRLLGVMPVALFYGIVCCLQSFFHVTFSHFVMNRFALSATTAGHVFSLPWLVLYVAAIGWGAGIRSLKKAYPSFGLRQQTYMGCIAIVIAALGLGGGILCSNIVMCLGLFAVCMLSIGLCQVLTWTQVQRFEWGAAIAAGAVALAGNLASSAAPVGYEMIFARSGGWGTVSLVICVLGGMGVIVWQLAHRKDGAVSRLDSMSIQKGTDTL
ncbi:MFS transporter [Gluconobacter sphaericus]|uniref:MFS transporter n=1 Tax=Gluconobacter sphaericus TaxID=574987 RepID=UPI001920AE0E|nr:MFS transporter [Gluconobacter sphaericus]QQX90113.1 MFS transporter [Gluconobacter sphaericus]